MRNVQVMANLWAFILPKSLPNVQRKGRTITKMCVCVICQNQSLQVGPT